jgi:hypothetical protein
VKEPANHSVVGWFDEDGGQYAVLQRDDDHGENTDDGCLNWFSPLIDDEERPMSWRDAEATYDGFRGPVLLVPQVGEA